MKLKSYKIGTQLLLGSGLMFLLVLTLGYVSYQQSKQIHQGTEILYKHPLKVKRAISNLKADVLNIRIGLRDLMLAGNDAEREEAYELMDYSAINTHDQFDILYNAYMGPRQDIDDVLRMYTAWNTARLENIRQIQAGELDIVKKDIQSTGRIGKYRTEVLLSIQKIDDFASKNGDRIYENSNNLLVSLNWTLLYIVLGFLFLIILINYLLIRNIKKPISILTRASKMFHNGDMTARSRIDSRNEFGELSDSFNIMVDQIQLSNELNQKASHLSQIMLMEEKPVKFFASVLPALALHTNSQMAAVYLLSDDRKKFEHFASYGMDEVARQSFAVEKYEGEFGLALATGKIQIIKQIPIDTNYVFHTVSGKLIPREIITIPILSGKEIIAVISLASVRAYSNESIMLIKTINDTLSSRIEGVLAYQTMQVIAKKLEIQNNELESQKTELESQTIELNEQNRELEMQKVQLSETSRLKTNFLSNMSHELRTPLNSVIALSGVLNRRLADKIPQDEYSYLEVIERNGKHLLSLINDILDISRIEAGKEEIEISGFSSKTLISEVVEMIYPIANNKRIKLSQKNDDIDLLIECDADKCRHILQNLIGNAVKFTANGHVEITTVQKGTNIEISIKDSGIGIAQSHLVHIFDEFRQADAGTSRRFGGTGLGLAIAKKYAHLLGGTIIVESILGEGSTFVLTLPLKYSPENRVKEKLPESVEVLSDNTGNQHAGIILPESRKTEIRKTILLVEDSEPAIIQMKDFMEESGYRIFIAHDGAEALAIISQTIPDAMILDLMLPGMDGFEVLKTIRHAEQTAHIPVLILTAKHITKDELRFLKRNNVHQLIQKGDINRLELLNSVASLVFKESEVEQNQSKGFLNEIEKPVILIVEDNPDNMLTVKAILENNYILFEAVDGAQGIIMANRHKPHLILMDIALPEIDGIEAFKVIRSNGQLAHIPVIALTASAMDTERETILSYGFDGYIAKPIDEKVFFKTINNVLYGK